jgi:hypothetical protein
MPKLLMAVAIGECKSAPAAQPGILCGGWPRILIRGSGPFQPCPAAEPQPFSKIVVRHFAGLNIKTVAIQKARSNYLIDDVRHYPFLTRETLNDRRRGTAATAAIAGPIF